MLEGLLHQLLERERAGVEPDARAAVAFDALLHPQEHLGVDGLRAGVAAPQAPGHGGEEEQGERADHQQA
ncbi:hypothetical protein D3C73_1610880 [compost metagenome]